MYNKEIVNKLIDFILSQNGIAEKNTLSKLVQNEFSLIKVRSFFYCESFAIRFCVSKDGKFSNTVLALSTLHKYDNIPFIVCIVTPQENKLYLSNSTFLKKISHSSQELRTNNIKGSFNGSDIIKVFEGVENIPSNFEFLYTTHENYTFEENLERLVEATNNISPKGERFIPNRSQEKYIKDSVSRAISFMSSENYNKLNEDLYNRVSSVETEIAIASFIDNVNIRGRIIEYLITAEDELKVTLIDCLKNKKTLPPIFTADKLGDYEREFEHYITATDIKTKILFLSSNPKGYNIDKILSFLSKEKSVYLVYIVAIDSNNTIKTQLCSMFNNQLLSGTRIIKHWAGRNSRGVTQYDGFSLEAIIDNFDNYIDADNAQQFLDRILLN